MIKSFYNLLVYLIIYLLHCYTMLDCIHNYGYRVWNKQQLPVLCRYTCLKELLFFCFSANHRHSVLIRRWHWMNAREMEMLIFPCFCTVCYAWLCECVWVCVCTRGLWVWEWVSWVHHNISFTSLRNFLRATQLKNMLNTFHLILFPPDDVECFYSYLYFSLLISTNT